jgi:hypothetical protein
MADAEIASSGKNTHLLRNYAWLKNKSDDGNVCVAGNARRCTAFLPPRRAQSD